jgi:DNA-nicking Smr family endonuclease
MPKNKDQKPDITEDSSSEFSSEFRQFIKNVKPVKTDKILLKKRKLSTQRRIKEKVIYPEFQFSDFESANSVTAEEPILFARSGISQQTIRKLRQGKIPIDSELDLHGCTIEEAREKLITFLGYSSHNHLRCVQIIHGKGRHSEQPILKNKINNWLRQLEIVLAFCSARVFKGGTGALLVLLKRKRK